MTLRISGKNVDIGDSLRVHAQGRIVDLMQKYFDGGYSGHAVLEKEGSGFRADCTFHLDSGVTLRSHGQAEDAYASFDQAAHRLEKRLRRYKSKLKDRHNQKKPPKSAQVASFVLAAPQDQDTEIADLNPVIIAEHLKALKVMSVGEAVMEMDLLEANVVVFVNAAHDNLNVVYKRTDGHIGWIDPGLDITPDKTAGGEAGCDLAAGRVRDGQT